MITGISSAGVVAWMKNNHINYNVFNIFLSDISQDKSVIKGYKLPGGK
jgi:hypothetical protein